MSVPDYVAATTGEGERATSMPPLHSMLISNFLYVDWEYQLDNFCGVSYVKAYKPQGHGTDRRCGNGDGDGGRAKSMSPLQSMLI